MLCRYPKFLLQRSVAESSRGWSCGQRNVFGQRTSAYIRFFQFAGNASASGHQCGWGRELSFRRPSGLSSVGVQ